MLLALNHILAVLLELAALGAFALWGWAQPEPVALRLTLAAAAAGGVALLWALLAAPKAAGRLAMPGLLAFKLLIFGTAAACLQATLGPAWAAFSPRAHWCT